MKRSSYTTELINSVLCITDLNIGKSVTNDAEHVIADLLRGGWNLNEIPVIYRDNIGMWDGLQVANGRFIGFFQINEDDQLKAIQSALHRAEPLKTFKRCHGPKNGLLGDFN